MVSLWPWRGEDSSPASFEKALSALSVKITATQTQLDSARTTSRRLRLLWTLYLSFAYLVFAIVEFLVVGSRRMRALEWTGVAASPFLIYAVRAALAAFFSYRIDVLEARLKDQQQERAKTIQKLKDATKYDTTLELLQKYGDADSKPGGKKGKKGGIADGEPDGFGRPGRAAAGGSRPGTPGRTNLPLPPTANVSRGDGRMLPPSAPGTPQPGGIRTQSSTPRPPGSPAPAGLQHSEDFAPNAFDGGAAMQQQFGGSATASEPHWYDRILDLLLGEDETASKNRIVLICKQCRLVNGQTPPGTKSLSELGMWKCMACGAVNGEMDEGRKIVKEVLEQSAKAEKPAGQTPSSVDEADEDASDLVEVEKEDDIEGELTDVTPKEDAEQKDGVRKRHGRGKK